jgi:hypothetical protein
VFKNRGLRDSSLDYTTLRALLNSVTSAFQSLVFGLVGTQIRQDRFVCSKQLWDFANGA